MDDRGLLVEALVGTKHLRLYLNSATFHAQIEVASQMLPIVVDALAVAATEEEAGIAALLKMMESTPMKRFQYPGLAAPGDPQCLPET